MYSIIMGRILWIFNTRKGKFLRRYFPMFATMWTLADVVFDAFQAKEYYDYSRTGIESCENNGEVFQNNNGTFAGPKTVNIISPIYFWISFVTFVFPPIMGITLYYLAYGRYGLFGNPNKEHLFKYKEKIAAMNFASRFCILIFVIPAISIIRAFIGYYIFLPFFSIFFSAKLMYYGKIDRKERLDIIGMDMYFTPALLPFYTLVEQVGEAGPQIALAAIFLYNNSHCSELYTYDLYGTFMPQIVISLVFSFGSFLIGTTKGIISGITFWRNYKLPEKS